MSATITDVATGTMVGGSAFVSPFVSPRGIVLTIWQQANGEGWADAYEAVYTVQSVNTTLSPLSFSGSWIDQVHNAGTVTLQRAPRLVLH